MTYVTSDACDKIVTILSENNVILLVLYFLILLSLAIRIQVKYRVRQENLPT
jgi:hypothetical protein